MKDHIANIYFLGAKELRSLWHDRVMFVLIIWAFTGGIYAVATATSQELHNAPIAFVDEDRSALSGRIIDAFYGPYFKTPEIIARDEIDPGLDSGIYSFVVNIPPSFEKNVLKTAHPEIQVNVDATQMTQAFIGTSYIKNIINGELTAYVQGTSNSAVQSIALATRVRFNPNLTSSWFGSVMEIMNNISMLSIILTGAALIREREHGTLEHLLVMPLNSVEIMLAKVWSMGFVIIIAASLSLYFVVQGLLNVPIAGSIPLFMFGVFLHLFSTTSLGILMGTLARNMPQLGLLMIITILPLQMLSGGITPRESMPDVVQNIMLFAPTTHFVSFAQAILYRGAGLSVVWPSFLAITAIGLVFFLLALGLFRKSLAAS